MQGRVAVRVRHLVNARAAFDQETRHRGLIGPGGLAERSAISALAVYVCAGIEQQFHHRAVAAKCRPHKRTAKSSEEKARYIRRGMGVNVRTMLQQQAR